MAGRRRGAVSEGGGASEWSEGEMGGEVIEIIQRIDRGGVRKRNEDNLSLGRIIPLPLLASYGGGRYPIIL